eukprot:12834526-Alexandrium_andersonii.AAC.1
MSGLQCDSAAIPAMPAHTNFKPNRFPHFGPAGIMSSRAGRNYVISGRPELCHFGPVTLRSCPAGRLVGTSCIRKRCLGSA